ALQEERAQHVVEDGLPVVPAADDVVVGPGHLVAWLSRHGLTLLRLLPDRAIRHTFVSLTWHRTRPAGTLTRSHRRSHNSPPGRPDPGAGGALTALQPGTWYRDTPRRAASRRISCRPGGAAGGRACAAAGRSRTPRRGSRGLPRSRGHRGGGRGGR